MRGRLVVHGTVRGRRVTYLASRSFRRLGWVGSENTSEEEPRVGGNEGRG